MRANRYVSYLAAEIEPQALANMARFERDANRVMESIAAGGRRGAGGIADVGLSGAIRRNADSVTAGARQVSREMQIVERQNLAAARSATVLSTSFSRAADALQIVQGPLGPIAGRLTALGNVIRNLAGFSLAGVLAGGGAFALGSIATQYQRVHDTLAPLYEDQRRLNGAMSDVIGIASRTRQALAPVAELYASISRTAQDAGLNAARVGRITETISKASRIGGGTEEGRRAAIIQFGQAFGAGFQGSGQELQSIREQTPALARAIASGLGVEVSQLKELAKEGKLSSELVAQAIERSADEIDAAFARMPPRVGQAITQLGNNLSVMIGQADAVTGATTGVAKALLFLAGNLDTVAVLAGTTAAAFAANTFVGAIRGATEYASRLAAIAPLTREQIQFNAIVKQSLADRAAAEVAAATTAMNSARSYQTQVRNQIAAIELQIAAQRRSLEMARTLDAAGRATGGAGRPDLVKAAQQDLNATLRARMLTEQQLVAVNAELAASDARLTAATGALSAANTQLAGAQTAAAASTGRLAGAKAVLQGALTRVMGVGSSLVGFLGGPWGVAFTAAAGYAMYLATRTDYAKQAIDNFAGGQAGLLERLDKTSLGMGRQAEQAYKLARALREAGLAKAEGQLRDVGAQTSGDLRALRNRLPIGSRDFKVIERLMSETRAGRIPNMRGLEVIQDVVKRNPDAAKGSFLAGLLGDDAGRVKDDVLGVVSAVTALGDARRALAEGDRRYRERGNQKPLIDVNAPGAPTKAQLNAQARVLAATDPLKKARAELSLAMQKGPTDGESAEAYTQRIAGLIQNVNSLAAAHKAAGAAKNQDAKAQAALNKELARQESVSDKQNTLANIMDQFSEDTPVRRMDRLRDAAEKAKRQVADLLEDLVQMKAMTKGEADAEFTRRSGLIDQFTADEERRPVTQALEASRQELQITREIVAGRANEAEYLRQKFTLTKQVGELTEDEEAQLRDNIAEQQRLNDVLEKRSAVIENNARMLDGFRETTRSFISSLLQGDVKGGFKEFFAGINQAFADARAEEITMKLLGDPGKKYRDEMTRGLNQSAENLKGSAGDLSGSATALDNAATALSNSAAAGAAGGDPLSSILGSTFAGAGPADSLASELLAGLDPAIASLYDSASLLADAGEAQLAAADEIVVVGKRPPKPDPSLRPSSPTEVLNKLGAKIGTAIGGPVAKILSQAGTALEGAQYGAMGSSIFGEITGVKQSKLGAGIGGAVGQIAGAALGKAVGGVLGSALGPLGGIAGGIIGGSIGGLFKNVQKSTSSISSKGGSISTSRIHSENSNSVGLAGAVVSSLNRVVDQLGGAIGAFKVSIGTRDDKFVVDPTGAGRTKGSGVRSFATEQEAVAFALQNAIADGAVAGIRAGTQRLLQAGSDLDAALDKALKFESVFKRLKRLKDPVGAAIDDLNAEFRQLISIFTEAGASAAEWADLQQLYDLSRAKAIEEATNSAVSALDEFIQNLKAGPDSPLSRRTVYNNARAEVDKYRADVMAGRAVDQQKLISALDNLQAASGELYGSRQQFFTDFADILMLAEKARANVGTGTGGALPPSPFDALTPIAQQQVAQQQQTNLTLAQILAAMIKQNGGGTGTGTSGGSTGGTIGNLPYYGGGTSYGGGGGGGTSGGGVERGAVKAL